MCYRLTSEKIFKIFSVKIKIPLDRSVNSVYTVYIMYTQYKHFEIYWGLSGIIRKISGSQRERRNSLKSLIFKDLQAFWKTLVLILLLSILFNFLTEIPGDAYLIVGIFMFAMQIAYLEEKNNTFVLFKTLPLSVSTFVFSKYVSTLIVTVIFLIFGVIQKLIGTQIPIQPTQVLEFILVMSVMVMLMGIFFILFFYKGYQKAYTSFIVIYLIAFFVLVFPMFKSPFALRNSLGNLNIGWGWMSLISILLVGLYLLTSLFSIYFFKKKEIN